MSRKSVITVLLFTIFSARSYFLHAQADLSEAREKSATERQAPDKVMAAVGVQPGMVLGEIGAGRGRYTVYLARKVGPKGKILANDINENSLAYLAERCRRNGFGNVETITGTMDDPRFPEKSLDMAIMVWVFHMLEKPAELLANLRPSLKPGAQLVILDPRDDEIDAEFGIDRSKPGVKTPAIRERIEQCARQSGFELVRVETFLPKDYIFILRVKPAL